MAECKCSSMLAHLIYLFIYFYILSMETAQLVAKSEASCFYPHHCDRKFDLLSYDVPL